MIDALATIASTVSCGDAPKQQQAFINHEPFRKTQTVRAEGMPTREGTTVAIANEKAKKRQVVIAAAVSGAAGACV